MYHAPYLRIPLGYQFRNKSNFQEKRNLFIIMICVCTCTIRALFLENMIFAYAKTRPQINYAVTAQLISAFVFTIWIVQSLYFLNPKFLAPNHLLWLHNRVCV